MLGFLDDIARRCLAGDALSREQAQWLGNAIRRFLTRQSRTIEDAFGVRSARGGVSGRHELAIRRRNAALVELAQKHLADKSPSAQAKAIQTMCQRYAATAWRSDRSCSESPAAYSGMPQKFLWEAFAAGAHMPISERQLLNVLRPSRKGLQGGACDVAP